MLGKADLASSRNFLDPSKPFNIFDNFSCLLAERKLCSCEPFSNILNLGLAGVGLGDRTDALTSLSFSATDLVFNDEVLDTGFDPVDLAPSLMEAFFVGWFVFADETDNVGDRIFIGLDELMACKLLLEPV